MMALSVAAPQASSLEADAARAWSEVAPGAALSAKPGGKTAAARRALTPADRVEISIPYPNAGMYLYRGIYGSFAGGRSREADTASAKGWQDPLFQWQGEVNYYYTPWFSGGVGFRINAGAPSDSQQTVENRYFLLTRFHKAWPRAAVYAGARLGVDDVNFSLRPRDTLNLVEPLRETNAGLGLEAGLGWKFVRYAGFTLGQRMDISLVRQHAENPNRGLNFMTQPGFALDMVRIRPELYEHVKAFYLLTEMQFGQSLSESGDWRYQFAWIVGLSLAF